MPHRPQINSFEYQIITYLKTLVPLLGLQQGAGGAAVKPQTHNKILGKTLLRKPDTGKQTTLPSQVLAGKKADVNYTAKHSKS